MMSWLRQRTRWLKGYVQTWLVHMRSPRQLWRELGPLGFLGLQTVVGGTILSALVHPWFYVLAGIDLARGSLLAQPEALFGWPFWLLAWFDLVTGYLASMAVGFLSARGRGYRHLMKDVPLMPLYWLLISAAACRALWQFMTARFEWEKTEHGEAGRAAHHHLGSRIPGSRRHRRNCSAHLPHHLPVQVPRGMSEHRHDDDQTEKRRYRSDHEAARYDQAPNRHRTRILCHRPD